LYFVGITVTGDRKNGVTSVKFRRPLQTNEPINDRAIPTDREVCFSFLSFYFNSLNNLHKKIISGVNHISNRSLKLT